MFLDFPEFFLGPVAEGWRIHDDARVFSSPFYFSFHEDARVVQDPANRLVRETRNFRIFLRPGDGCFRAIHMYHLCSRFCGGQTRPSGVSKEIQNFNTLDSRTPRVLRFVSNRSALGQIGNIRENDRTNPIPVRKLFGEKASMFEGRRLNPKFQSTKFDLPPLRHVAPVFPLTFPLVASKRSCSFLPHLLRKFFGPERLWIGTAKQDFPKTLKLLSRTGVHKLISLAFSGYHCLHVHN